MAEVRRAEGYERLEVFTSAQRARISPPNQMVEPHSRCPICKVAGKLVAYIRSNTVWVLCEACCSELRGVFLG